MREILLVDIIVLALLDDIEVVSRALIWLLSMNRLVKMVVDNLC